MSSGTCERCKGVGTYESDCSRCGDSGDDHECIYRTLQCHKCSGTGKDPRFAAGYAEGRASERADMLAFVEEACRLGTQGDALLRALMAKGRHEGAASIVAKKGTP